jgi:hypothetical protein
MKTGFTRQAARCSKWQPPGDAANMYLDRQIISVYFRHLSAEAHQRQPKMVVDLTAGLPPLAPLCRRWSKSLGSDPAFIDGKTRFKFKRQGERQA